jgi:hypothetical protein
MGQIKKALKNINFRIIIERTSLELLEGQSCPIINALQHVSIQATMNMTILEKFGSNFKAVL